MAIEVSRKKKGRYLTGHWQMSTSVRKGLIGIHSLRSNE